MDRSRRWRKRPWVWGMMLVTLSGLPAWASDAYGPEQCLECHPESRNAMEASVHGAPFLKARGLSAAEIERYGCMLCHAAHGPDDPRAANAPVTRGRDLETCGECHERERGIFLATFHGKHQSLGKGNVPTCVYCHAGHERPRRDPNAPIHPANLGRVCAGCHGGDEAGQARMAQTLSGSSTGSVLYRKHKAFPLLVQAVYTPLTLGSFWVVLGGFLAVGRAFRGQAPMEAVPHGRFFLGQILMFLPFFLAVDSTGVTLLYASSHGDPISWIMNRVSRMNMAFLGSDDFRSLVHRLGGIGVVGVLGIHLVLLARRGDVRQFLRVTRADLRAAAGMLRGQGDPGNAGRFWTVKMAYWLAVFFIAVMAVTGLILWNAFSLMKHLPFSVVRYADLIHEWNGRALAVLMYGFVIFSMLVVRPLLKRRQR